MKDALEIKTKVTYDSWGFEGIRTYYRLTHWSDAEGYYNQYWARVSCTDTSTGHGWCGRMSKEEWESL
jgi:hypothetical protein